MMAVDSQHVPVHLIGPSGMSFRWSSPCCRACSASVSAPHFAQHPAPPPHVQASCLERARPMAVAALTGGLAVDSSAPPEHRGPERKRRAKAKGKIKGRGTSPLENPVCTWGWRGTRQGPAACRESALRCIGTSGSVCFARLAAPGLDGDAP
jgi:hypothetical protein